MLSPHEKRDKIIRSTDLDALSCRFSANKKSYFDPKDEYITKLIESYQKHLQYCQGYSNLSSGRVLRSVFNEQKLPIINRGTYLRTKLIDVVLNQFVEDHGSTQIISLGGGSDTRAFRILDRFKHKSINYVEIDFTESVKIKKLAIVNDENMCRLINHPYNPVEITEKQQFLDLDSQLHTTNYQLIDYDLRQLGNSAQTPPFASIDPTMPTIVLSECVLCYLSPQENADIISYWCQYFNNSPQVLSFLIYEPMSLNDAFGTTMAINLSNRGIDLQNFNELSDLEKRDQFLKKLPLRNRRLTDISEINSLGSSRWLDQKEFQRINRLELLDEVEELNLLFRHYCLVYCESSHTTSSGFSSIDTWNWLLKG